MANNYELLYAGNKGRKQKIKAGKFKLLSEQEIRNLTDLQLLISIKQTKLYCFPSSLGRLTVDQCIQE
jgi:ferredoxin-fold anticodon binding domain-containing protein